MRGLLLALLMSPAALAARVEGRVVDLEGSPIPRATVALMAARRSGQPPIVITDDQGRFAFSDVDPGTWTVAVQRTGFRARTRNGIPGDVQDLTIRLAPQATISGTVTDQNGDPLANRVVDAFRATDALTPQLAKVGSATTDDQGNYRIVNLGPGDYYVGAQPIGPLIPRDTAALLPSRPDGYNESSVLVFRAGGTPVGERSATGAADVFTYFPNAREAAQATAVKLAAGTDARGIDIRLLNSPTYFIRGVFTRPDPTSAVALLPRLVFSDRNIGNLSAQPRPDGSFEFANIPVGSYRIVVDDGEYFADVKVNVAGADVENVALRMAPMPRITGNMSIEGVDDPPTTVLQFTSTEDPRLTQHLDLGEGDAMDHTILPGSYRIGWFGHRRPPEETYIKSIRFGNRDALHAPFTFEDAGSLDFVFSPNVAEVTGTVKDTSGKPVPRAAVTLWPREAHDGLQSGGLKSSVADEEGRFSVADLGPGRYFAAAWVDVPDTMFATTAFPRRFSSYAVEITLDEKQHATLDLTPIPAECVAAELP